MYIEDHQKLSWNHKAQNLVKWSRSKPGIQDLSGVFEEKAQNSELIINLDNLSQQRVAMHYHKLRAASVAGFTDLVSTMNTPPKTTIGKSNKAKENQPPNHAWILGFSVSCRGMIDVHRCEGFARTDSFLPVWSSVSSHISRFHACQGWGWTVHQSPCITGKTLVFSGRFVWLTNVCNRDSSYWTVVQAKLTQLDHVVWHGIANRVLWLWHALTLKVFDYHDCFLLCSASVLKSWGLLSAEAAT